VGAVRTKYQSDAPATSIEGSVKAHAVVSSTSKARKKSKEVGSGVKVVGISILRVRTIFKNRLV
jgi:hypothetical protein